MGNNEPEEGSASPRLPFGNVFVGRREIWQELPLTIREQCKWLDSSPANCDTASLVLFDGEHPDCFNFLARSCAPVIVVCRHMTAEKAMAFTAAGAFDVACTVTETDQIVSVVRVASRLSGRFNHALEEAENKQSKTLLHTAQSIGAPHDISELLVQIADSIMDVISAASVCIVRVDVENQSVIDILTNSAWRGYQPTYTYPELHDGLTGYAIRTKQTIVSSGLGLDEREKTYVQEKRTRLDVGPLIIAPLLCDNQVIGTVAVSRKRGQPDFTRIELDTATTMVQMGALAIKNAQSSQKESDALDHTQILFNVAEALISSDSTAALLERVLKEVINGLFATGGMYIHYDVTKKRIVSAERFIKNGDVIETQAVGDYSVFMRGLSGYAIRTELPILSNEQNDKRQSEDVYKYRVAESTGSVIVAPIINGGTVLGTLSVHRLVGAPPFTGRQLGILTAVANQIASALIHVRSFEDTKLRVDILAKRLEQRNHDLEVRNDELRHANMQLQQVDKLKDKFINEVSHELRRPVSAFRLYLSMLAKWPQNIDRYLETLNDETDKFEHLITAILDLARLHLVDTHVQGEPVDFAHLIRRNVSYYQSLIEANGVQFEKNLAPLPNIIGVSDLLEKMIEAILDNTLCYTDKGFVIISSGHEQETIWLEVQDSGIGIAEEEIPLIHRRFYRSEKVKQDRPGIGVGLSFAHEIIKLHGGTLNVTSVFGEGSTFRVTLPKRI